MITIRNMKVDDWEEVSHLDTLAFNSYLQKTGQETRTHHRTQANLVASLALHPKGCFIAEKEKMVGYIFSRIWGKLGWIGTFGVDPDYHGQGIGKKLIVEVVDQLKEAGCTTIGLETMPDSPYNVGLYTTLGFNSGYPTLYLTKTPAPIDPTLSYNLLSNVNRHNALAFIASLSQTANHQVDYVVEAENARKFNWGDTLLFGWPRPYGFTIARSISVLQGSPQPTCGIICLVLAPDSRNQLGEVLQLLQSYAYKNQASQITIPVNAIDSAALREVISDGFRIRGIMLRMIYQGKHVLPEGIDLSRWAM